MKLYFHFTILFLISSLTAFAQVKANIVDDLNTPKSGQGSVKVYVDPNIKGMLASTESGSLSHKDIDTVQSKRSGVVIKCPGFKIQVFSGNDQRKSKNEAYSKQGQIRNRFPDIDTVVSFHSPFWRLRAGNFRTYAEAAQTMAELKRALPSLGREMYIVKDTISIVE